MAGAASSAHPSRSQGLLFGAIPSPTTLFPVPFEIKTPGLQARQNDGTSACPTATGTPNTVIVQISSQVTIADYSTHYPSTPIEQFQMAYSQPGDGSLLAPPFQSEVRQGNWFILFVGMMLMLFLSNTIVSADYVRRGRVRYKGLFYALLASQLFGVGAHAAIASTFVIDYSICSRAFIGAAVLTELSAILLLSGILGVKAYRCLGNSKFVLVVVIVLQAVSSALSFSSISGLVVTRQLSLNCSTTKTSLLHSIATALRSILSLFICLCFLYALGKSIKLPAAQGRISLRLSGYTASPNEHAVSEKDDPSLPRPRGWWDYVPGSQSKPESISRQRAQTWHVVDEQGFIRNMRMMFGGWIGGEVGDTSGFRQLQEKEKYDKLTTMRQPRRRHTSHRSQSSTVRLSTPPGDNSHDSTSVRSPSPSPSKARSLRSLMDRMKPFRELMKNELGHAALITVVNVVATVLGLVGAFGHVPIPQEIFISSYWGILSLLVIHSFGRVIKRLEREALIQSPSTWDPLYHVEKATNGRVRPGLSTASVASNPFKGRSISDPVESDGIPRVDASRPTPNFVSPENPFEDFDVVTHVPGAQMEARGNEATRSNPARADSYLLPDAPQQIQPTYQSNLTSRDSTALLLRRMSGTTVSDYSFGSSDRQSLFYLEKQ